MIPAWRGVYAGAAAAARDSLATLVLTICLESVVRRLDRGCATVATGQRTDVSDRGELREFASRSQVRSINAATDWFGW